MGYPMKKEMKIKLIFLYWEVICASLKRAGRLANANFGSHSRLIVINERRCLQYLHQPCQVRDSVGKACFDLTQQ